MVNKPLAQTLFEDIREQKMHDALNVFSKLAEPCIEQMKEAGLVKEVQDDNGNTIVTGTTELAVENSIADSCEAIGTEYVPTWLE